MSDVCINKIVVIKDTYMLGAQVFGSIVGVILDYLSNSEMLFGSLIACDCV